eukprot:2029227-Pyramimonas_sp.AAC.1
MVLIYYVMLPHRGEQVRDGRAGVGAVYARGSVRLHRAGELQVLQPREDHEPGAYHGRTSLGVPFFLCVGVYAGAQKSSIWCSSSI